MYTAHVSRDGRWWMISVDGIAGLTQARRLGEAELMAREFIAATLDLELDGVAVTMTFDDVAGIAVGEAVRHIAEKREAARTIDREATSDAAALARSLAHEGIPLRDIGTMLGVSHQRAAQLVEAS